MKVTLFLSKTSQQQRMVLFVLILFILAFIVSILLILIPKNEFNIKDNLKNLSSNLNNFEQLIHQRIKGIWNCCCEKVFSLLEKMRNNMNNSFERDRLKTLLDDEENALLPMIFPILLNENEIINEREIVYISSIINEYNYNIFKRLVCSYDGYEYSYKLKLIYSMTRDGRTSTDIRNKIIGHSNLLVLIKTNRNKIFGGYTSIEIDDGIGFRKDEHAFLFSIDLNEKFEVIETEEAMFLSKRVGLNFGSGDIVIFDELEKEELNCYSWFGSCCSKYENNDVERDEFCGEGDNGYFVPIQIEVYEVF